MRTCASTPRQRGRIPGINVHRHSRPRAETSYDVSSDLCASATARAETSSDVYSDLSASARARAETSDDVSSDLSDPALCACGNVRRRIFRLWRLSACGMSDLCGTSFDEPTWAPQRVRNVLRRTDFGRRSACGNVLRRTDFCDSAHAERPTTYLPTLTPQRAERPSTYLPT